jgi:hypothetical protein
MQNAQSRNRMLGLYLTWPHFRHHRDFQSARTAQDNQAGWHADPLFSQEAMEHVHPLSVPLSVDQKVGGDWREVT